MSQPTLEELLKAGETERARALAEQILKSQPGDRSALLALARLAIFNGEPQRASELLNRVLQSGGPGVDTMLVEAAMVSQRGEVHKARMFYEEVLRQPGPPRAEAHFGLGFTLAGQKEWAAARQHLEKAVELEPEAGPYRYHLARVLLSLQEVQAALPHLQRATELIPSYAPIYVTWGSLLQQAGDLARAEEALRQGLKLLPEDTDILNLLSNVLLARGKVAEAVSISQKLAQRFPDDPGALGNYARLLMATGNRPQALAICRELAARGKATSQTKSIEAMLLEAQEPPDVDGAVAAWYEATRLDPENWGALTNLGNLLMHRKTGDRQMNLQAAAEALENARERSKGRLEPTLNLALAYARLGDNTRARTLANEVIQRATPQEAALRDQAQKLLPLLGS